MTSKKYNWMVMNDFAKFMTLDQSRHLHTLLEKKDFMTVFTHHVL